MKNFEEKIKSKMTAMPRLKGIKSRLSIKIVMWKFLRGGATLIPGATFIPESRVGTFSTNSLSTIPGIVRFQIVLNSMDSPM